MIELLHTPAVTPVAHLLLAHGAGAAMTSPFMETIAGLLAERGIAVTRFEFAYMAARRQGGKRRPPPKAELLVGEYRDAVAALGAEGAGAGLPLLVGGKSMGGRVASLIADALHAEGRIAGLVCLGYPLHPVGQPDTVRVAHLAALACPALIVQGERDPFGTREEVAALARSGALSTAIRWHWAGDGDHDLGPRGGRGHTRRGNLAAAADAVAAFADGLRPSPPP